MKCKQLIMIATLVVFSFGLVSGQAVFVNMNEVEGLVGSRIPPGVATDLVIPVHFTNPLEEVFCMSNGFDFTSVDVTFGNVTGAWNPAYPWNWACAVPLGIYVPQQIYFDMVCEINDYTSTVPFVGGVGFAGLTGQGTGLPAGFDDVAVFITVPDVLGAKGDVLVMDSTYWEPGNIWVWCNPGDIECAWGGPYEFIVDDPVGVDYANGGALPTAFALNQNYPNPFNPTTEVHFDVPTRSNVRIDIYNVLGQQVKTLVNEEMAAGSYSRTWDGTDNSGNGISSGVYLYKMEAGSFVETKKMMMLK